MVGRCRKIRFVPLRDDTIPGDGQPNKLSFHFPPTSFLQGKKLCLPPFPPFFICWPGAPQTSLLSRGASPSGFPVFNFFEYEPCRTCYLEVYTIFGAENIGSVYYFRIWKPWKCILFSGLKTVEVYTIFGNENRGSVYYYRSWKPWKRILFSKGKSLAILSAGWSAAGRSPHCQALVTCMDRRSSLRGQDLAIRELACANITEQKGYRFRLASDPRNTSVILSVNLLWKRTLQHASSVVGLQKKTIIKERKHGVVRRSFLSWSLWEPEAVHGSHSTVRVWVCVQWPLNAFYDLDNLTCKVCLGLAQFLSRCPLYRHEA